jgi:sodium/pantothenate symporter
MSNNAIVMSVLLAYLAINLWVGIWAGKRQAANSSSKNFIINYFIANRSMGGFVLAMTLVATYTSASSFIGAPGMAYTRGLSWVFLSMIQVPTAFIILAALGKKFAIISRRINAVTISDYLRARYQSRAVVICSSLALVLFFISIMVSQFIGGAVLFESVTGLSYLVGLSMFGVVVIAYTVIGGFRAVVVTDTLQGVIMAVGGLFMLATVIYVGGGTEAIMSKLNVVNPHWATSDGGGSTPQAFIMSFWVLVGLGTLGLPQSAVRCMAFRDSKSLHRAMFYGSVVIGVLMFAMTMAGVYAPAIIDQSELSTSDYVVPAIVMKYMNPLLAGLFLAAPLAAVMSTVTSLLILASATIIKDLFVNYLGGTRRQTAAAEDDRSIRRWSMLTTMIIGVAVFLCSVQPPDLIVWVNLFAFGGLECAFLCPIIGGLYWKRANASGCLLSIVCGLAAFFFFTLNGIKLVGALPIVPSLLIAVAAFIAGSLLGRKSNDEITRVMFAD